MHIFDVEIIIEKNGFCPKCKQIMSYRSIESVELIDKIYQKYLSSEPNRNIIIDASTWQYSALLEDIRSMWNVGSMFRTADGAGFSQLYLCGITAYPPRKELAKTSLGAEDSVSWQYFPNSFSVLKTLKKQGVFVLGLEHDKNSISLSKAVLSSVIKKPLCLVVGNEVNGISHEVRNICNLICHIPMKGIKESLNVAVAFGVAAYMLSEFIE
jgi:tRNA G18 (ribose-2'-O)-methylase SpoU